VICLGVMGALVLFVLAAMLLVKACGLPVHLSLEALLETVFPWALLILAIVVSIVVIVLYGPIWWAQGWARERGDALRFRLAARRVKA